MDDNLVMLEVVFEDVEVSKMLFKNRFYPQSLFYFQQSTEKAIKFVGLTANVIEKKDLLSDIGHKSLKIFKKAVKESYNQHPSNSQIDVDKEFQFIQDYIKKNDLKETIPMAINQIIQFKSELPIIPFDYAKIATPDDLLDILNEIDPHNPDLIQLKGYSNDIIYKKILLEQAQKFIRTFPGYIQSILVLFVLGCIVNDHVSSVRYPGIDMINPSFEYNVDNALVSSMPFFQNTLSECIKKILEFSIVNKI